MNIDKIFKIETIENEDMVMQKCTVLTLFHMAVFVSYNKGRHFSFSLGLGPIETEFSLRFWLVKAS